MAGTCVQLTQLFLAQQAQIRLIQWLGGILMPLLIAFNGWLVFSVSSTQRDVGVLQGKLEAVNGRLDQIDKTANQRFDQLDKTTSGRFDQLEKMFQKIDAKLDKLDGRVGKLEKQKG